MKKSQAVVEDTPKLGSASKRLKAQHKAAGKKTSLKQFARDEASPVAKEWANNKNPKKPTKPKAPATVTPITTAKKEEPKKPILKKR